MADTDDPQTSVEDVIEELYGLPRDDFIARRDESVKRARAAGDRTTAAAIAQLRKPSVAAWMANVLAREFPDEVGALEELGTSLRAAQDRLEGEALRRLSRRRHELLAALVARVRRVAREDGVRVGDGAVRELERTVTAALSDPDAARALAAGRLVSALEPGAGLGDAAASTSRAPARPGRVRRGPRPPAGDGPESDPGERTGPSRTGRGGPQGAEPTGRAPGLGQDEQVKRSERERAERERAERERREAARDRARREVEASDAAVGEAVDAATQATAAASDAEAEVAELRRELTRAEDVHRRARDEASEADRVLAARRRDAEDARARLRDARDALPPV